MKIAGIVNRYRSRKYWLRVLLSILLLVLAIVSISSVAQYYNYERVVAKVQKDANLKVLSQVNYNIEFMNELVKKLSTSLFFSSDIMLLLNSPSLELTDFSVIQKNMMYTMASTPFLHSIIVYNSMNGCYYYSFDNGVSCEDDGMNGRIDQFLSSHRTIDRLRMVPMAASDDDSPNKPIDFFSVFMFNGPVDQYRKQSTLIVNIKPEWLFNNVTDVNTLTEHTHSNVVILDSGSDAALFPSSLEPNQLLDLNRIVRAHMNATGKSADNFMEGTGANKKIINYMTSQVDRWVVVNVQQYREVFGELNRMRVFSMALIAACILLAVVIAYLIAIRLYRPIERVVRQIHDKSDIDPPVLPGMDEFGFIESEFAQAKERIGTLKQEQTANTDIVKSHFMRKLIHDSSTMTHEELHSALEKSRIFRSLQRPLLLAVFKIDNFYEFQSMSAGKQKILRFATMNIANEILSRSFAHELIDMHHDHFVLLMSCERSAARTVSELSELCREAQDFLLQYYKLSFTVAVSDLIEHPELIDEYYRSTLDYAMYRLLFGKASIITPDMVRPYLDKKDFASPADLEKLLLDGLRRNNREMLEEQSAKLFGFLSTLNHMNITYLILHMIVKIQNELRAINLNNIHQVQVDLTPYYNQIMQHETLEEIRQAFSQLFEEICCKRDEAGQESINPIMIETIKDIVKSHYPNMNLGLQSIAEMTQLSPSHISKIFRMYEKVSIAEYITDYRMGQAQIMLADNKFSINEILEKTGFGNKSYFFRQFKAKYGTTPKEYRIKKVIRDGSE